MDSLLPLAVKDQCPEAILYRGTKRYSLMIPLSQFQANELKQERPTSFLSTLRKQYPEGASISFHKMKLGGNEQNKQEVVEISFGKEQFREEALSGLFVFDGRNINVYKSLMPKPRFLYQIHIDITTFPNIPEVYETIILDHLRSYGAVLNIHWHYTEDSEWFVGEGCGFLEALFDYGPEVSPIRAEGYTFKLTACPCYNKV